MPVNQIRRVDYGVEDVAQCIRFFREFGLRAISETARRGEFLLPDGSMVAVHAADDPSLPPAFEPRPGVRRLTWGVDTIESLRKLESSVARDRAVRRTGESAIEFVDDAGVPTALEVCVPQPVFSPPDLVNAPGRIERWNRNRRWYSEAAPKVMQHIVFAHPDVRAAAAFYVNRLGFRISDIQDGGGFFMRADGRNEHHNIFWQPGPALGFRHLAFGVESLDELMAGVGQMQRKGWKTALGLGRHRISSTFFCYFDNPAGGDAEYSTDTDYLDDDWTPRVWGRKFGHIWWVARGREEEPQEQVRLSRSEERVL